MTVAKRWKQPRWVGMDNQMVAYTHNVCTYVVYVAMEKWRNQRWYTPTTEYYPTLKKKEILPHATRMRFIHIMNES